MAYREIIEAQIRHQETPVIPYSLGWEGDIGEKITAYYGHDKWISQVSPFIGWVMFVDTNRKTFLDQSFAKDPYGSLWRIDQRPWHLEQPALSIPSMESYHFPSPQSFFLSAEEEQFNLQEAIRLRNQGKFVIAYCGWGLFERSWTIRGFENALTDMIEHPEFYEELLDRLTDLYLAFIRKIVLFPVDAICFGDDWGEQRGLIMGPILWRRFLKPRWAKLFAATHEGGKITICHSCGSVVEIIPDLVEIGLDVLESCQPEAVGMNPYELKQKYGDKITFWGGIGSQSLIPFGTPQEIEREVERLCKEMGKGGGYILAPAKPLQPETPTINAVTLLESMIRYSRVMEYLP